MYTAEPQHRAARDLLLGLLIALSLAILNVAINFPQHVHQFFAAYSGFQHTSTLVNVLFLWLAVLLWFSFRRWRRTTKRRVDLEAVVSGISPDALFVVAPDRAIVMCTDSVERVFGYKPEELLNSKTDTLYDDRRLDKTRPGEIYEALEKEGFHVGRAEGRRKNGETFPLEIITGELAGREGAVLVARDITERVRAEDERVTLEARMREQQKLESLGRLASGIAHDFNNLVSIVMAKTELALMDMSDTGDIQMKLQGIRAASEHAGELCKQMMAYAGKGKLVVEPFDLSAAVRDMVELLQISIPKTVALKYDLQAGLPLVTGDVVQNQQIAMNLMRNAAEALGKESGRISVTTGTMECSEDYLSGIYMGESLSPGPHVFLEVSDTGPGMDDETKARIFDPFFTTKSTGRGLGLATVIGIVRGHSGAMDVRAAPGEGSAFKILLPCADKEDGGMIGGPETGPWRGKGTILVIDEDKSVRSVAGRMLSQMGFSALVSSGGDRAIEQLREHAADVAVVLLDVTPSHSAADEVLASIRHLRKDVPVVLSSTYGDEDAFSDFALKGVSGFLHKPYDVSILREKLREILGDGE